MITYKEILGISSPDAFGTKDKLSAAGVNLLYGVDERGSIGIRNGLFETDIKCRNVFGKCTEKITDFRQYFILKCVIKGEILSNFS